MKEIRLNNRKGIEYIAQVDDEDFEWLSKYKWRVCIRQGLKYARRSQYAGKNENGKSIIKQYQMHIEILSITDPKIFADHRDGNGLNNQRSNLRIATSSGNAANRRLKDRGKSKYIGVSTRGVNKIGWTATCSRGKVRYRKYFRDEVQAALWYNERAKELHGEFAMLNKIDPIDICQATSVS